MYKEARMAAWSNFSWVKVVNNPTLPWAWYYCFAMTKRNGVVGIWWYR